MADAVRRQSSATEAAALAHLHDYLRRASNLTEEQELIARDAFVQGFGYGGRWAIRLSSALSNPDVRVALAVVAEALSPEESEQ